MMEIQDFNIKRQNQMSQNLNIVIFNLIILQEQNKYLKLYSKPYNL